MRVFVTGATGFVGTAVVLELLKAGHKVLGLAYSDDGAKKLEKAGVEVHRGNLTDLESLKAGALKADAVIHSGFIHDFSKFKESCELDRKVIGAIGSVLVGTKKPFIITSGIGLLPSGQLATESMMPLSTSPNPRLATEQAAQAIIAEGVNASIVRLPPTTHGKGDHGFIPMLIDMAKAKGSSAYIGEGANTWAACHRDDAARVYRLAMERAVPGSYYHAVAEEGIPFKKIAEAIGQGLGLPVVRKSGSEVEAHFTWFAHFAAMNVLASSKQTQAQLNWRPEHVTLFEDLKKSDYFEKK